MDVVGLTGDTATGKTTVGHLVALELGAGFLDIGVLTRLYVARAQQLQIPFRGDDGELAAAVASGDICVALDPRWPWQATLNSKDVTAHLQTEAISQHLPNLPRNADITSMLNKLGDIGPDHSWSLVAAGRKVQPYFPFPILNIHLTVDPAVQLERTMNRLGKDADLHQIEALLESRRERDKQSLAESSATLGVQYIDTSHATPHDVANRIIDITLDHFAQPPAKLPSWLTLNPLLAPHQQPRPGTTRRR